MSLDTVRPETFNEITRRDRLKDVIAGLEAAREAGLAPLKINAVLLRGANDDQAGELLQWALDPPTTCASSSRCRWTPSTAGVARRWSPPTRSSSGSSADFTLTPHGEPRGSDPAELFDVDGGPATVGIIASVTRPFCGDCDRVRLTADGQIRNCLFAREESDLRTAMRAGATDDDLAARWVIAMAGKLRRPRHRRRVVPAARSADVRDRRIAEGASLS